jgi:hypothetical protein
VDLNTVYLALRRARWLPDEKRYVPVSENLFYSNAFKPGKLENYFFVHVNIFPVLFISVSSSVKKCQYDYSSDLLQITELSPLRITLSNETNMCTIRLSYLVSD